MQRQQQQVDDLDVLAEEQPLVEVAAKAFAVPQIPQVLFVHRRVAVRNAEVEPQLPVHRREDNDVDHNQHDDRSERRMSGDERREVRGLRG